MKHKIKNTISLFLALVMIFSLSITASAASVGNNLDDILWDWEYYYNKYPDLKVLGRSASAMRNHYLTYGKKEGRSPSSLFDPVYYLNKYSDLKNAFGTDYSKAYDHFVIFGVAEGRQGSASFNVQVYKNNYVDLRNAFGIATSDNYKYLKHWREFGEAERRNATTTISSSSTTTTTYYVSTNGANLTVRSGPGTSYSSLGYLSNGSKVSVYDVSNGWARISYNNTTGYLSYSYLTTSPNNNSTSVGTLRYPLKGNITRSSSLTTNGQYCDYKASSGTPVYAPADGTVVFKQAYRNTSSGKKLSSYGNFVEFTSSDGTYTIKLCHLSSFNSVPTTVKSTLSYPCSGSDSTLTLETRSVKQGELLGYSGMTGNASGPHLHLEVKKGSTPQNPASVFTTW